MAKKKVTLSVDARTYDSFKKYCEDNAIMLSKRFELFMKEILRNRKGVLFMMFVFIVFMIGGVNADVIFSDDFEDNDISDWEVTDGASSGWFVTDTESPIDSFHVIARNTDSETILIRNISTTGYENIEFNFWWSTDSNLFDAGDFYYADWYDGSSWTNVFDFTDGSETIYLLNTTNLSSNADNNADFKIRFRCNTNLGTEGCNVDNVSVVGDVIAVSDDEYPLFSGFVEGPSNNSVYSSGASYEFNVTIDSTNGSSGIEFDGVNYSVYNLSNIFNISLVDLEVGTFGYYWWSYGNGTSNNYNYSEFRYYSISKAGSEVNLTLNGSEGNITINDGDSILLNGTLVSGDVSGRLLLYNNGSLINNATTEVSNSTTFSGAGLYNISVIYEGSENYSLGGESYFVEVIAEVDSSVPNVTLLTESPGNGTSYSAGAVYEFNATVVDDNTLGNVFIEFNGTNYTLFDSGSGVYNFTIVDLGAGSYSYYWYVNDSSGNVNNSENRIYSVSLGSGDVEVYLNGFVGNVTVELGSSVTYNVSVLTGEGNALVYENGGLVSEGAINSNTTTAGTLDSINITAILSSTQNYSSDSQERFIDVEDSVAPGIEIKYPLNTTYDSSVTVLNYSANDLELQMCWYSLDSGESNISITCGENVSGLSSIIGSNTWKVWANDSSGNLNVSSITFVVSTANNLSSVTLNSPGNNSNVTDNFVILNASIFDLDLDNMSVWFYGNGSVLNVSYNVTNGTTLTYNWSGLGDGDYNWSVVANDGNANSTEVFSFFSIIENGTKPNVSIKYPSYFSTYNETNISLNYTIAGGNLGSCWYSIDNGLTNNTINGCGNSTLNVGGDGFYNLSVYVNESLTGKIGNDNISFYVNQDEPTIHLKGPRNGINTNESELNFTYVPHSASGAALEKCELWSDFNGTFGLNQSNSSALSQYVNNEFVVNLTEGNYLWGVRCDDVNGNSSITGNRTLNVDYTAPIVNINSEPSGAQSTGGLTFQYSVNDSSSTTCTFSVTATSSGSVVFSNTASCDNIILTFNVNLPDGNYASSFIASDSAGNSRSSSSSFSVNTGSTGGGSGGGGGGGGGSSGAFNLPFGERKLNLEAENPGEIFVKRGGNKLTKLKVTSKDLGFINNCKLEFRGSHADWFSNEQVEGLSPGEIFNYDILINAPENAEIGSYLVNIEVNCQEGSVIVGMAIRVFVNDFEAEIDEHEREGNNLIVYYNVQEFVGKSHEIIIDYLLVDLDGVVRYRGEENFVLEAGQKADRIIRFDLPKDSFGEFDFRMRLNDGETEIVVNKEIFLPSGSGVTGLAISDDNRRVLTIGAVVLVGLIVLGFVGRFIYKHRKKIRKLGDRKRGRILLDINPS